MQVGLEWLVHARAESLDWGRCALLCNQASVNDKLVHAIPICQELLGDRLIALFSPQHGLDAVVQDNMIETQHGRDLVSGLPIFSLYSETREPSEEMLEGVDTIIVDLQLVGCRVYTFKWTIAACLRAAKKYQKRVVILDRPNPLGGEIVEGRVLDRAAYSFVGEAPIPLRHALTTAEFARFVNQKIGAELSWLELKGWDPTALWSDLNRKWVLTSPNLPTFESVLFYPGMVLFEGTNLSEGRGTCLPFQQIGAPYITDSEKIIRCINESNDELGAYIRPARFQPTSGKWAEQVCSGVHMLEQQAPAVRSVKLALSILSSCMALGGDQFAWKQPPYEYDYKSLPINLILGSQQAAHKMESYDTTEESFWTEGIPAYLDRAKEILLYERVMRF